MIRPSVYFPKMSCSHPTSPANQRLDRSLDKTMTILQRFQSFLMSFFNCFGLQLFKQREIVDQTLSIEPENKAIVAIQNLLKKVDKEFPVVERFEFGSEGLKKINLFRFAVHLEMNEVKPSLEKIKKKLKELISTVASFDPIFLDEKHPAIRFIHELGSIFYGRDEIAKLITTRAQFRIFKSQNF